MKDKHIISADSSIIEALRRLNALPGGAMTLFVEDAAGRLIGTLTDGDVRRALIAGTSLEAAAGEVCHSPFRSVTDGDIDPVQLRGFRNDGITLVPVVDGDGRLVRILDISGRRTQLPLRAVLMAGGKGERLRPATLTTPKPLLRIEGKAIIDYNVEALAACGIEDITVSTGYLAEQLYSHFSTPVAGVNVKCVREDSPLGTVGAVTLTEAYGAPGETLVMNSDLLTTISFEDMYLRHRATGADVTIAAIPYQVSVPYAILTLDSADADRVTAIEEKPSSSYYANAGIYIFSDNVLALLEPGHRTDATDLIETAIARGFKVTYYPIRGTWIDVGSPVDFRQAAELMRHHNSMSQPNS